MKEKQRIIDGDFFDYLQWRGDLSFSNSPLCEVDALILCQLSYIKFNDIIPADFSPEKIKTLSEYAEIYEKLPSRDYRKNLGVLINAETKSLLKSCAASKRFSSLKICGLTDNYDLNKEEQFCAMTFICSEEKFIFIAFRGTDDSIIGWKEDFNLAFMEKVPAQIDSCKYLRAVLEKPDFEDYKVFVGGHSKGGNLAIYSAAKIDSGIFSQDANLHADAAGAGGATGVKRLQSRITKIYNFDGPGFSKKDLESDEFLQIKDRVVSVFPQTSMIGMLFNHFEKYEVVRSTEKLILQHDTFSWRVQAVNFSVLPKLDEESEIFFASFNLWFEKLTEEQRKEFVETLFSVLLASKAKSNSELAQNGLKSAARIIKAFALLESEKRDAYLRIIRDFIKITGHEVKELIDRNSV